MSEKGLFSISVDARYQLHFGQEIEDLLKVLFQDPNYGDIRNDQIFLDRDTGIVSVHTTLTTEEDVEIEDVPYKERAIFDPDQGQWYPTDSDDPKIEYDGNGIIEDLKSVLRKMDPIGQVMICLDFVRMSDYEQSLDKKYVGEL